MTRDPSSGVIKRGDRVTLRELRMQDVENLFQLYKDPAVTYNLSFDSRERDEVVDIIERMSAAAQKRPRTEYLLAVEVRDGSFIGIARLAVDLAPTVDGEQAADTPRSAQLGGALRSSEWRKGYGAAVARLLMDLGFHDLGLHRLWGARGPENIASRTMMEHLGMTQETLLRDHVFTNGAWRDSVVHAILRDQYLAEGSSDT